MPKIKRQTLGRKSLRYIPNQTVFSADGVLHQHSAVNSMVLPIRPTLSMPNIDGMSTKHNNLTPHDPPIHVS